MSGRECCASLTLLDASSDRGGIHWFYGEKEPRNFKVIYENRTTVLVHSSGKKIISAEHLNAAALAFPNCEFALDAPQGELPLLDGSAKLWKEALEAIATPGDLKFYTPSAKEFRIKIGDRYLNFVGATPRGCPYKILEIQYTINRFGQKFTATVQIKTPADLEKILLARTFIFEEELQSAKLSENLRSCGLLLQNGTPSDLRFENEPAYHKILDFLGDISLHANALPLGKFTIFNGGHQLHHTATGALMAGHES